MKASRLDENQNIATEWLIQIAAKEKALTAGQDWINQIQEQALAQYRSVADHILAFFA